MAALDKGTTLPIALASTLREVTERLAKELASSAQHAPDWSDFEWSVARAVAAMHGVSPLLSRALRWRGPDGWVQFLEEQRAHTTERHARIGSLLHLLDESLREADVASVALKGAALHAIGIYGAGDRPMADIDLLVRPADAQRTARLLESLGYRETGESWKERVFTPLDGQPSHEFGEHSHNGIKIEMHERICERLPWRITDISERIFPPQPHAGLNAYPSKASLMTHLLLHAAGSMAFQALRLLHLHDIARLSSAMNGRDWQELLDAGRKPKGLWWAHPPLMLTSRYFRHAIPAPILTSLGDDCPYLLQRASRNRALSDVSFSYPWVDAFPGIGWSQSLREILGYAASRVWPSAEHVASRARIAKSEAWVSRSRWPHLSQSRRILRWMTSRPTRPPTMHAIRAVLAGRNGG